jgi:hypothetical protein
MANDTILNISSISEADLVTPTSTQKFPLGLEIATGNVSNGTRKVWKYIQADNALSQYGIYTIKGVYASNAVTVKAQTPATSSVYQMKGVAPVAFTDEYYGFVQIEGNCTILATSSTGTAGNFVKAINAAATVTDESTTRGTASVALCLVTAAGASTTYALLGEPSTV